MRECSLFLGTVQVQIVNHYAHGSQGGERCSAMPTKGAAFAADGYQLWPGVFMARATKPAAASVFRHVPKIILSKPMNLFTTFRAATLIAPLGYATAVSAQNSATLYGVVDDALAYTNNQLGKSNLYMLQGSLSSSRFGLRAWNRSRRERRMARRRPRRPRWSPRSVWQWRFSGI